MADKEYLVLASFSSFSRKDIRFGQFLSPKYCEFVSFTFAFSRRGNEISILLYSVYYRCCGRFSSNNFAVSDFEFSSHVFVAAVRLSRSTLLSSISSKSRKVCLFAYFAGFYGRVDIYFALLKGISFFSIRL